MKIGYKDWEVADEHEYLCKILGVSAIFYRQIPRKDTFVDNRIQYIYRNCIFECTIDDCALYVELGQSFSPIVRTMFRSSNHHIRERGWKVKLLLLKINIHIVKIRIKTKISTWNYLKK